MLYLKGNHKTQLLEEFRFTKFKKIKETRASFETGVCVKYTETDCQTSFNSRDVTLTFSRTILIS